MFQTKVVDKKKTNILCLITFFNSAVYELMWETYFRAGQATDKNMAHAHCMLDTQGYKHTLRICNTYCSSTTTMVTRTPLNVTLYVHCLPVFPPTSFQGNLHSAHSARPSSTQPQPTQPVQNTICGIAHSCSSDDGHNDARNVLR